MHFRSIRTDGSGSPKIQEPGARDHIYYGERQFRMHTFKFLDKVPDERLLSGPTSLVPNREGEHIHCNVFSTPR